ncbi:tachykinin-like peptides receptor 86C [Saccoglossus kowalevskii]
MHVSDCNISQLQTLERRQFIHNCSAAMNLTTDAEMLSYAGQIALSIFYSLVILMSLTGNAIVVYVLNGYRLKHGINVFLINLAIADIALTLFCSPFTFIEVVLQDWIFGDVMCTIVHFTQQVTVMVSIFTLVAICVDRYTAVINPLKVKTGKSRNRVVIITIWIIAALLNTPLLAIKIRHGVSRHGKNSTSTPHTTK